MQTPQDPVRAERKDVLVAGRSATTITKVPLCEAPQPKWFTEDPLMSWCFIHWRTMPSPICRTFTTKIYLVVFIQSPKSVLERVLWSDEARV